MSELKIGHDQNRVYLILDGKLIADMPWQAALEFSQKLRYKAKLAEEFDAVNQIVSDQALLLRAGVNLGLSNDRRILDEAGKEAQWGNLRRYIPSIKGIASKEVFGTPRIIQGPPK